MAETLWDFRNGEHRDRFGVLLSPLIVASRSRDFIDRGRAKDQLIAWVMSLKDVPLPLLEAGVERLMAKGVNFMPRPGELREACCDIADEQRRDAARRAAALAKDCVQCGGTQWVSEVDGNVERVKRCWCFTRALELIAEAGEPLKRPALPPSSSEPPEAT